MYVAVGALRPLFTIAKSSKVVAHQSRRIQTNVSITTSIIRASATKEMETCGGSFWREIMRKIAEITSGAKSLMQEVFT